MLTPVKIKSTGHADRDKKMRRERGLLLSERGRHRSDHPEPYEHS